MHSDSSKKSYASENPAKKGKGGVEKENPVKRSGGKGKASDNPLYHPGNKMAKK